MAASYPCGRQNVDGSRVLRDLSSHLPQGPTSCLTDRVSVPCDVHVFIDPKVISLLKQIGPKIIGIVDVATSILVQVSDPSTPSRTTLPMSLSWTRSRRRLSYLPNLCENCCVDLNVKECDIVKP